MEDFKLGFEADSSSLPDFLPQTPERAACLGDSAVDLSVNVRIAIECATQVCESLYCLWYLSIHRYLRLVVLLVRGWLVHYFRLLGAPLAFLAHCWR